MKQNAELNHSIWLCVASTCVCEQSVCTPASPVGRPLSSVALISLTALSDEEEGNQRGTKQRVKLCECVPDFLFPNMRSALYLLGLACLWGPKWWAQLV